MQVPRRRAEQHRKFQSPATDAYLTAEAIARLEEQLGRLEKVERPKAAEDVARLKEMGDLSENAAYTEAKSHLRRINDRITSIRARLARAIVIPEGAGGIVGIGSTVELRVDGNPRTYRIVGSQEADPSAGRISHLSPIGQALLGHKAGDRVVREIAGKEVTYEIVAVR